MSQTAAHRGARGAHEAHHEELGFWRKYVFSTDHKVDRHPVRRHRPAVPALRLLADDADALAARLPGTRAAARSAALFGEARMPGGVDAARVLQRARRDARHDHGLPRRRAARRRRLRQLRAARSRSAPRTWRSRGSTWRATGSTSSAASMMLASFFVPGGAAQSGWTSYAPLADIAGDGPDVWLIGMVFLITSSLLGVDQLHRDHDPAARAGARLLPAARSSCWAQFVTSFLLLLAFPPLEARGDPAADGPPGRHELLPAERARGQRPGAARRPAAATRSSGSTCSGSWPTPRSTC